MENDSIITKLKILIMSTIFLVGVIALFIAYKELEWGFVKIISCIIASIYVFFLLPMIKYIINWVKTLSVEEAVYSGYKVGYYGIGILIILNPIIGIMYYFNKKLKMNRNGRFGNIIIVGWYIV